MGSIEPYDTANGKRYRVRYRKPDRAQSQKRGFTTKRDAALFLASVEVSKSRGEYVDPTAGKIAVGAIADEWLANKRAGLKASSFHSIDVSARVFVLPRWADTPISSIRPSAVETWVRELVAGTATTGRTRGVTDEPRPASATVVLRAVGTLAGILDMAVRDGRIPRNPARGLVNLPKKVSHKARRYLTHDEAVRVAEACTTETHRTLVLTLAYCGLRWGEAVGLRVRDVNALRRRIHVARAAVEVDGKIVVGTPKTHERRTVPYPSFLAHPLAQLCEGKGPDSLIFTDAAGGYVRRPKTSAGENSWFLRALIAAGVERLTPHDLRHTAASLAVSSGANVKAVQRMLGHASASMTLDVYADLFDDDLDAVAARLEEGARGANVAKLWPNALTGA
ncbi:site-specific integrase [Microbacterium sp. HMWF026]|uniref:tyrosine-type recombinase/integrase n=1 Tax=Microbacterium sp. HMWF026 TaxID=2056861 RepID=UPI000D3CA986|nr:site-specific integrase [Microbacterium sp. HMWF026]PTT20052.1 site-specific integrase [Microbacterium sp. HMWF026]